MHECSNACCTHTSSLMELMEARIYGASSVVTWLYRQSFLPDDIENWLSFTVLLAGILSNVYLGLYVSEKNSKTLSGMRVLVGNQVFANLLGIFSHAFFPTYNVRSQDDGTRMNQLCKIMPSLGFLGVAVSLSNLACICVSYYLMKKGNRSVCLSRRVAWLVVSILWFIAVLLTTPLAVSLRNVEMTVNKTSAHTCAIAWQDEQYQELFLNNALIFKYIIPLLVIFTACVKVELISLESSKKFGSYSKLPAVLTDILAGTCLLLLICLFPVHNACAEKTLPFNKVFGSATSMSVVRILELIALANCSAAPLVLKSCIDEYSRCKGSDEYNNNGDDGQETKYSGLFNEESECFIASPSANVAYVTYDVLTEDLAEEKPIPAGKDVKVLITT